MIIPTLHIVQGFLGAGKTTYSKTLADETAAVRLNADEYCEENFSESELADWDRCFSASIDALWLKAEEELKTGNSVVLDFGFWDRTSRDHARAQAERLDVPLVHVFVTAPDEVLKARIARRSGPVAEDNLRKFEDLKRYFEPPHEDEKAVVIDSSKDLPKPEWEALRP